MARVKRGNVSRKRHKKVLKLAKGFRGSLSVIFRQAKPAVWRALSYAYRDRRNRKRDFRRLWIARISAAVNNHGVNYSQFMNKMKKNDITLNRKVLSELAIHHPKTFTSIVEAAK
ncbi:50S ribosomal protein L20 [bacterium]|jgi:large subunit ribosomal protein L20|nr:50S ribosomal protein L20 [bacterium]